MSFNVRNRVAWLGRSLFRRPGRRPAGRPRFRPALEGLEDRSLLSTLTVLNLNDSGNRSLRSELAQAQGGDTVVFTRGLRGAITLTSGELRVGQDVTIQGPGAN